MFVDYKLFLILILSLVLLYTYNKVESLRLDIKKINHDLNNDKCLDNKCSFNKKKDVNIKKNDIEIKEDYNLNNDNKDDIENEINKFKEFLNNEGNELEAV